MGLITDERVKKLQKKIKEKEQSEAFLKDILKTNIENLKNRIEELDQNKTYYICAENEEEVLRIKHLLQGVQAKMNWTIPKILITSEKIKGEKKT